MQLHHVPRGRRFQIHFLVLVQTLARQFAGLKLAAELPHLVFVDLQQPTVAYCLDLYKT